MVLTNEGQVLYVYVKQGIEQLKNEENAILNMKNLDIGILRIGSSTTISRHVLMPYLELFYDKYPNVDIQIVNNLTDILIKDLRKDNLDVLLLNMPMRKIKDLKIISVMDVHDIFVGNKKYFNLTKKANLFELGNYPLLFQKSPSNTRSF